ncbi:hypothetical protein O7605_20670 [Verrucosispora sp. WMMA2121]|uniref:hypothetical protein n=1 Tax=Verrucosispora sp. WMMA2121 TaxID=3015164 RepID=UPI0022B661F7|nr:hypothetical protein [Verrucosispora sp. WMMA2121]MCZ7421917.1 hypothetical protein [Verrucosispora sp. WMMA2121]
MITVESDRRLRAAVRALLGEIETLTADFGPSVQDAVAAARATEVSPAEAERLYTRVLRLLRDRDTSWTDEQIADEVRKLLDGPGSPSSNPWGEVSLVERNGLSPHLVTPVPRFNNLAVPMYEGYVDVGDIDLWPDNHRVELQVAEFEDRNRRAPDPRELLELVQGKMRLPSLNKRDPYSIEPLAKSIARKGVERAPILTHEGVPMDGNRRIAAAKAVLSGNFTREEKERARWVKVWVAPPGTTPDQFDAVVVALNFEDDLKEKWPEFVKARLVVDEYRKERDGEIGGVTTTRDNAIKKRVAEHFAITATAVTRYIRMVQWAEDFEEYHVHEQGRDQSAVRYKADDIFQWFYEIQAGKSADKITTQMEDDPELRKIVYDLMFEVMDTGTQVRSLWKVVADEEAMKQLEAAHDSLVRDNKKDALDLVKEAVNTADRNTKARKKLGFDSWLRSAVDRLGSAPPDNWRTLDSALLKDLQRVFVASTGVIEAELVSRGERPIPDHA